MDIELRIGKIKIVAETTWKLLGKNGRIVDLLTGYLYIMEDKKTRETTIYVRASNIMEDKETG